MTRYDVARVLLVLLSDDLETIREVADAARALGHTLRVSDSVSGLISSLALAGKDGQSAAVLQDFELEIGDPKMSKLFVLPTLSEYFPSVRRVLICPDGVRPGPIRGAHAAMAKGDINPATLSRALGK